MSTVKSPEKVGTEELPLGWMIEVKTRKCGSGMKTDRYYTDPVTGYIFRSLKDVQRYLKTGQLGRQAIKPKVDSCVEMKTDGQKNSPEPCGRQPVADNGDRKRPQSSEKSGSELPQRASKRLAVVKLDAPLPPSPPEARARPATRLAGMKTDAPPPSPPFEPKTHQATRLAGIKINAPPPSSPPVPKTRHAKRLAGIEVDAPPPSLPELKPRQATQSAAIKADAPPPSPPEPKTRRATRLASIKVDAPPPSPPEPKTRRQSAARREIEAETNTAVNLATPKESDNKAEMQVDSFAGNADMDNNRNIESSNLLPPASQESCKKVKTDDFPANEKQELHTVMLPVTPSKKVEMEPSVLPPVPLANSDQPPPTTAPPANSQPQDLFNPPAINPIAEDSCGSQSQTAVPLKPESPLNFSLNDLWTDPCIEFAVKTLTGAIPFGDLNKPGTFQASPPLEVPLEELWTDPCIEFAVKTLTGAIPVSQDLCVQDYLPHQPTCGSETRAEHGFSLPDVGTNGFCQTEVLSKHFENKPAESVVVPPLRNGGLPNSGKGGVPQGSGSNGQCSRGRFFQ